MNANSRSAAEAGLASESRYLGMRAERALNGVGGGWFSRDVHEASSQLSDVYNTNRLRLVGRAKDFGMRLRTARVGRLGLATLSFGAEIDIEQAGDRPFVLITTQVRGFSRVAAAEGTAEGGQGFVVIDSAGQAVSKRFSRDSERCNLRVDQAILEAKCAELIGRPLDRPLRFAPFCAHDGQVQRRWIGLLQVLLGYVDSAGPAPAEPIIRHLEEGVLLHLLLERQHSFSDVLREVGSGVAPRHVKRAEDYIRAHAREALTLARIADAIGCSVRSLSEGFRQARGTTPMNFLRRVRLDGVRRDLGCDLSPGGISEVALGWGFSHLGRFSAEYRCRFGESPSDTVRRHT